tara:strand:- start:5786 stop:6100 length:315 start_codon:yes stop_codon:yes gene_type:complete
MKILVNTETKDVLYKQGKYPVGHIKLVMDDYIRRAEWYDTLHSNMKIRIGILQARGEYTIAVELIEILKSVNAWWDESMEDTSNLHSPERDFHLRQYGADKLGR